MPKVVMPPATTPLTNRRITSAARFATKNCIAAATTQTPNSARMTTGMLNWARAFTSSVFEQAVAAT